MTSATTAKADTQEIAPAPGARFTVASRVQRRFSNVGTVSNLAGSTSFQTFQLPATGFVRRIHLYVTASVTSASAGAIVAGDGPFNLLSAITLTDATGQPIFQPISGYHLMLINKWLPSGSINTNLPRAWANPQLGPEYAFASTATTGTATFRLTLELEQDANTGYGCIPNLDSNSSLQLKIDVAPYTVAFTGTTTTVATVSVRVEQEYWAAVGDVIDGVRVQKQPVGFGDYVETRYETQTVSASAENLVTVTNRGGMIKGLIAVSRAANVRTAFTAGSNVGFLLDNNPIDEGITLESQQNLMRRYTGNLGAAITTSYAPLSAGIVAGVETGVLVWPFFALSGGRDSWLATRVGSLAQIRVTPGASATTLELVTQLAQVKDFTSFYAPSALS